MNWVFCHGATVTRGRYGVLVTCDECNGIGTVGSEKGKEQVLIFLAGQRVRLNNIDNEFLDKIEGELKC